ncbi:MAG: TetR/AcrR family transcriptional regulator [Gordonia sp. (in: high G+C Gram-positive bacteria)]|uniref:TetR/AcrR family transcriptional regulator n=1 Tax=Gordonia sp. (in: high G+C Gram-positive bacteria) TaxID=84139 RepID=UPI0039E595B2
MTVNADATSDRDRVLAAASRLFYTRGVQAVGMDAVRTEAGVPLKRLYAAFPSKDALLLEVLSCQSEQWNARLEAAIAAAPDPRGKLLAVFDFLGDWFGDDDFRGCLFVNAFGELGAVAPDVARAVRAQKDGFRRQLTDLVAEFGGPAELGPQLALLAEGAQTTAAIDGTPDTAQVARAAAAVLLDAAGGR